MPILRKWILVGLLEIVVGLILIAIAPIFLNSTLPWIGFLIWFGVLSVWCVSSVHVFWCWSQARQARQLFLRRFPDHLDLTVIDFLGVSRAKVWQHIELLDEAAQDPELQLLNLSPLDLFRQYRK